MSTYCGLLPPASTLLIALAVAAVALANPAQSTKRISWYTERCGPVDTRANKSLCDEAVAFATQTSPTLVDGLMSRQRLTGASVELPG